MSLERKDTNHTSKLRMINWRKSYWFSAIFADMYWRKESKVPLPNGGKNNSIVLMIIFRNVIFPKSYQYFCSQIQLLYFFISKRKIKTTMQTLVWRATRSRAAAQRKIAETIQRRLCGESISQNERRFWCIICSSAKMERIRSKEQHTIYTYIVLYAYEHTITNDKWHHSRVQQLINFYIIHFHFSKWLRFSRRVFSVGTHQCNIRRCTT